MFIVRNFSVKVPATCRNYLRGKNSLHGIGILGGIFWGIVLFIYACRSDGPAKGESGRVYYIDSNTGADNNDGRSEDHPFRSIARLQTIRLRAGDTVRLSRGSVYQGPWVIRDSGSLDRPIVITDYGLRSRMAPAFSNPRFEKGNFGNCLRIAGSHVVVENLYCHLTTAYVRGDYTPFTGWDTTVWEMGAIYIEKNATHCVIRNNEMEDCVVGVRSYGPYTLIKGNYIHDCNRVLKEWGWGPLGIWLGGDHQEACYNRVFNYRAENPKIRWEGGIGGGADGGAFEIDDARFKKSDISIHHNYTRDCQGFLEVTWTDILQQPDYSRFSIHHNISDDYQQFVALWCGRDCHIEQNTIVRRKKNRNDWGVFNITQHASHNLVRNNIIVTEKNIPIFNTGLGIPMQPGTVIANNLYYSASGNLVMGKEGPGSEPVYGDPLLKNYSGSDKAEDFSIRSGSPAIRKGLPLGYGYDFAGVAVNGIPDIGAYEYVP